MYAAKPTVAQLLRSGNLGAVENCAIWAQPSLLAACYCGVESIQQSAVQFYGGASEPLAANSPSVKFTWYCLIKCEVLCSTSYCVTRQGHDIFELFVVIRITPNRNKIARTQALVHVCT